jgi:hypothetical protein
MTGRSKFRKFFAPSFHLEILEERLMILMPEVVNSEKSRHNVHLHQPDWLKTVSR